MNTTSFPSQILTIIAKYLDLTKYQVFLFGSRARGMETPYSDYDIGIEGIEKVPYNAMLHITGDIEETLPLNVDVRDFKNVSEKFYQEAKKYTLPLSLGQPAK